MAANAERVESGLVLLEAGRGGLLSPQVREVSVRGLCDRRSGRRMKDTALLRLSLAEARQRMNGAGSTGTPSRRSSK